VGLWISMDFAEVGRSGWIFVGFEGFAAVQAAQIQLERGWKAGLGLDD
jgi:hypothetical protein